MQNICMYEIIVKRKLQLDHLSEGLSSLGFSEVLTTFTEILKPAFVGGKKNPSVEELLNNLELCAPQQNGGPGMLTYQFLQQYLMELDEKGTFSL